MQSWNAAFFLFFLVGYSLGGGWGISGRVRALNLTVPLGSGRVGSDNLGYGPGSGFSFEPVQTSNACVDGWLWLDWAVIVQCSYKMNNCITSWFLVVKGPMGLVSAKGLENVCNTLHTLWYCNLPCLISVLLLITEFYMPSGWMIQAFCQQYRWMLLSEE